MHHIQQKNKKNNGTLSTSVYSIYISHSTKVEPRYKNTRPTYIIEKMSTSIDGSENN